VTLLSSATPQTWPQAPGDVITVLSAVHHASDVISRVAAKDQEAVITAAAENRLYVPVRLLSDKYDIPHSYTLAPRPQVDALLAAYETTADAATGITAALDDLAAAVDAPSSLLAAARQAPDAWPEALRQDDQRPASLPPVVTPVPGRTEHALRDLQIHDPALLLRAAVIDQAARDLVAEATAKVNSRATVSIPDCPVCQTAPGARQAPGPPVRIARQDAPLTPLAMRLADHQRGGAAAAPASRSRAAADPGFCPAQ
jgi:hypothetical protein